MLSCQSCPQWWHLNSRPAHSLCSAGGKQLLVAGHPSLLEIARPPEYASPKLCSQTNTHCLGQELFAMQVDASSFINTLDLCQWYLQVPLHPDSCNLTGFMIHIGGLSLHLHDLWPQLCSQLLPEYHRSLV